MAEGYVTIAHDSYVQWKILTEGHSYDVDGQYGCQCWDYVSVFWYNVGFPQGYPITQPGGDGQAWMCWTVSRDTNKQYNGVQVFDLIYNIGNVKKGDIVVLNGTTSNPAGHIAFADEDYAGTGYLWCIGQNQGGTPLPGGGTAVTRNQLGMGDFLGAFRYRGWEVTPPVPPVPTNNTASKFKWALYARNLRNKRNNML